MNVLKILSRLKKINHVKYNQKEKPMLKISIKTILSKIEA